MKAIVYTKYGSPEVLQIKEVDKPVPKDNEVLVNIHATVVSITDTFFRKGDPFVTRMFVGLTKPKNTIPGVELSGEIEAVGKDVTLFKPGDQIYGATETDFGAHAQYKCLPEQGALAIKPANISYGEAAAFCDGCLTALTFLKEKAHIRKGQKILINGASGSVGSYSVQLAKYFGAEVTGVCSGANLELVKSIGADHVIDYTTEDFTRSGNTYDIILDTVGNRPFSQCKGALTSKGIYLTTVFKPGSIFQMLKTSIAGSKKAIFATTIHNRENLDYLRELIEAGKLSSVIDKTYTMEQIAEAHAYVETGHKKGNVVLTITEPV